MRAQAAPLLVAAPLFLVACQREAGPANQANQNAPASNAAAAAPGDVGAAETLVRQRLGGGAGISFVAAQRSASGGVPIVCGAWEQGGARHRYIVVNGEDAFVETQMRPGEMDRAVGEFCRPGTDNRPPPTTPVPAR